MNNSRNKVFSISFQIVESCPYKFVRLESALRSVSAIGSATRQLGFNTEYLKVKVHLNNVLCFYLLESEILSLRPE